MRAGPRPPASGNGRTLTPRRCASLHHHQAFLAADAKLMAIAKQRKKLILKTKPYFECKAGHDRELMRASRRAGSGPATGRAAPSLTRLAPARPAPEAA